MLRIQWKEYMTSEEALMKIGTIKKLIITFRQGEIFGMHNEERRLKECNTTKMTY